MIGMSETELNALIVVAISYTIAYEDAVVLGSKPVFDPEDAWWVESLEEAYDSSLENILSMEGGRSGRYFVVLKVHQELVKAKEAYTEMIVRDLPADNLPF